MQKVEKERVFPHLCKVAKALAAYFFFFAAFFFVAFFFAAFFFAAMEQPPFRIM
jgi:hypothetical protein